MRASRSAVIAALLAALLFGASTPFAKILAGDVSPILLAGLLYLGSGLGLAVIRVLRDRRFEIPRLRPNELVHAHSHFHDSHHRHAHDVPWDGEEPHTHEHRHDELHHHHPHYPDLHHRHGH